MAVVLLNVEDNNAPNIALTLKRNGTVIDLTGASVDLIIKNADTNEITNAGHQACTVTDATGGIIAYVPAAGDVSAEGRYLAEVKITYSGGKIEILHERVVIVARAKAT